MPLADVALSALNEAMENGAIVTWLVQALIAVAVFSIRSEITHVRELLEQRIDQVEKRFDDLNK